MRAEQFYVEPRERCRANLLTPLVVRDIDYAVQTARSGMQVLEASGLTEDDVLSDPTLLLRSDEAYGGGNPLRIDPFHEAARPLFGLRLAAGTRDEDVLEAAVAMAVDAIAEHGVPPEITDVHSVGQRALDFLATDVIAALYIPRAEPHVDRALRQPWLRRLLGRHKPQEMISPSQWADRVDAGYTMIGARASMPQHHRSRLAVTAYTRTVLNPLIPVDLVLRRGEEIALLLTESSEGDQGVSE